VYLIAGLGNPGKEYQFSRHNMGFLVLQNLAARHDISIGKKKFEALYGSGDIGSEKALLLTPMTYMNRSGQAVSSFLRYFNLPLDHLIVVHDDLDLSWGRLRLAPNGGAAGHKGILSLIDHLQSKEFIRLRVGIGRPAGKTPVEAYVLQPFSNTEKQELPPISEQACEALEVLLSQGLTTAMNRFNVRKTPGSNASPEE
jgi:peptidyl-tRNA hydrolase, PTH1 family